MPALKKNDPPEKMNFDEFMRWVEDQEGRWELHDGVPVRRHDPAKGQSQRARHVRSKVAAYEALKAAYVNSGANDCEVFGDGMTVRVDENISYEPDVVVSCGERIAGDDLVVPDPVIIVEVLSPSTAYKDVGDKLVDYFKLTSLAHYLIIDPKNHHITHHYRDGEQIEQKAVHKDELSLDPPGLVVSMRELKG